MSFIVASCDPIFLDKLKGLVNTSSSLPPLSGYVATYSRDIFSVDYDDGSTSYVGNFGPEMQSLQPQLIYDSLTNSIIAIGHDSDFDQAIFAYDLDSNTGSRIAKINAISPYSTITLIGIGQGQSLYATTNDSGYKVLRVSLSSPEITEVGTITGLSGYSGDFILNPSADKFAVYSTGVGYYIYALSSNTTTLIPTIHSSPSVVGFTSSDDILAFRWNGSAEEVISIDSVDGSTNILDILVGFTSWQGQVVQDRSNYKVHALANGPSLFEFDSASDTFIGNVGIDQNYILVK